MTPRIFPVVAVAATVTMLGCGVIGQVKQAADNISAVGDLAQKLTDNEQATFTAEYRLADGSTTTVVQQPPNAAFIGPTGRFVVTPQALLMCGADKTCQKSSNGTGGLDVTNAGMIPTVAGTGFISAPLALAMFSAASVAPGVKIDKNRKTIAGQHSTCLKVSNLKTDADPTPRGFAACVTDGGLLASFAGDTGKGQKASIEMTRYADSADPQQFAAPAGYQVINVDHLQPPSA
jgi:hypothetical protein